uniref:Methyltransferase n=1 Tax=viral metagenome TaxID=1070528 RepID=A0A6C0C7X5_9ZZZZ
MDPTKTLDEIGMAYHTPDSKSGKYEGGDKLSDGQNFTQFYHEIMSPLRDNDVKLLEIGIFNGKSIAMWADYFPNGTIYGIDQSLVKLEYNLSVLFEQGAFRTKKLTHIYARRCDLHTSDFLPNNDVKIIKCNTLHDNFEIVIKHLPDFNIIVDDGNHNADSQCRNFELLFEKIISGGMYIIEDIVQPIDFYSVEHFATYFDQDASIDKLKEDYIIKMLSEHKNRYEKLDKSLAVVTNLIEINTLSKPNQLPGLIKSQQQKLEEKKELDMINSDTLGQKFDKFMEIKQKLIPLISRIEKRPNNIIFYRK